MDRCGPRLAAAAMVLALVGAGFLAHLPFVWTPDVVPAAAPATTFSAQRAMDDLRAVAQRPIAAYNPGPSGIEMTIGVRSNRPIAAILTDHSSGLPDLPGVTVTERPAGFMPALFDFRDPTVVRTRVEL